MERGHNVTEKLTGTQMHINIDHWGIHDCLYKEKVYKKPSTRYTKM